MRSLILKDLILNKKYLTVIGILFLLYMGVFFSRINSLKLVIILITFLDFILLVMLYTREDRFKATVMSCSLPATRRQIILARYILGWALMIVFYTLAVTAILVTPGHKLGLADFFNARTIFLALGLMTLYFSILMPLLIWFGIVGFFVFLVGMQVLAFITLNLASEKLLKPNLKPWVAAIKNALLFLNAHLGSSGYYAFLLAVMLLLSLGSFICSVFVFKRKDL